ncbi:effector binding domain-containing protein [Clostridium sp. 'deep sea']|uniref:MerR family transcriptional regulator n=1 Tax=Clostridium sp. 'deep sea' TaxID=2779445 RepID=UPI0018969210|nr:MerR family transcriptional regulator [Clostridium sp. 'deep sea']QOR35177.1 effector binding domain-containing protein [Clostridium sp. 'deep sea']
MELKTIRQVSLDYGVSRRMLSYYEEMGLIKSSRVDNYAYRVYNKNAIQRLQQIIILRKLQIPVKQIKDILNNQNALEITEIFSRKISELDQEITAISTLKSILMRFVDELKEKADVYLKLEVLNDKTMLAIVSNLAFCENKIKEKISLEELNEPNEVLNKLADKDVRIVYLPPMTVAAAYATGEGCEGKANATITQFVRESGLLNIKPDARSFGFDCSKETRTLGETSLAYEAWVSIPNDLELPAPLLKRTFNGGLYAAHVLRTWDFQDWRLLNDWVNASDKYDSDCLETVSGGGFEETLNYYNFIKNGSNMNDLQLDLLFPIKEKNKINNLLLFNPNPIFQEAKNK